MTASPALELRFPPPPASLDLPERLLLLLDDLEPLAIDEGTSAPDAEIARPTLWRVHFSSPAARDRAARVIANALGPCGLGLRALDVEDEGWVERSQAQLKAVRVDRVIVAPPWDVPPGPDAVVVVIRPSRGFGTGHHASTRLCLQALQRFDLAGRSVVDVGGGSGVLAIAAVKLGAARAVAIDCDSDAVANARENVELNGVADRAVLHVADLAEIERLRLAPADVVLANLAAAVLERHAGTLCRLTAPGGALIVSGVLRDQAAGVAAAFRRDPRAGLTVADIDGEEDWVALTLHR